uniref:Uncharacterized protein n=1 Tax=Anguilla anguilla TaxID=7936 RepID=A0A0E9TAF5_ANGAN
MYQLASLNPSFVFITVTECVLNTEFNICLF